MRVRDLEGKEHPWNLTKYVNKKRARCSEYHKTAREILSKLYPFDQILEEVHLPGTQLYADFFIPKQMLVVEVQGEQHTNFTPFFHKDKQSFGKAKQRDKVKLEWCEINNIRLVELSYTEDEQIWREKIIQA